MFCNKCGTRIDEDASFCNSCGATVANIKKTNEIEHSIPPVIFAPAEENKAWKVGRIIKTILIIVAIAIGIFFKFFNFLENEAVNTNNNALTAYDSGNSEQAISQFKQASDDALSNDNKINSLKNLAYVYATESKNDLALKTFQEALALTSKNTFDYYLISGEIALLNKDSGSAKVAYEKAYEVKPNEFQINNALTLFYLDLEEVAPKYADYKKALMYAQKANEVSDEGIKNITKENLAIAYFYNKKYDQALTLFLSLDSSKKPYINYWIGLTYLAKEDGTNARNYLLRAKNAGVEIEPEINKYLN